jgi:hypothetical protein
MVSRIDRFRANRYATLSLRFLSTKNRQEPTFLKTSWLFRQSIPLLNTHLLTTNFDHARHIIKNDVRFTIRSKRRATLLNKRFFTMIPLHPIRTKDKNFSLADNSNRMNLYCSLVERFTSLVQHSQRLLSIGSFSLLKAFPNIRSCMLQNLPFLTYSVHANQERERERYRN